MDILLVVLRLLHILAAFLWIGLSVTLVLFVAPAAAKAGASGLRFMKSLLTNTSLSTAIAAASGLTVLAGILLYLVGNSASHFSTAGNIVLGIGAVLGILASLHGGMATGRASSSMGEALVQYVPDGDQPIPPEGLAILGERAAKLAVHTRISLVLMIVALVCMGSARYL
jgi:hypothetical protein